MKVLTFLLFVLCNIDNIRCDLLGSDTIYRTKRTGNKSLEMNQKWNATWTDKLKRDLLLNYDKYAMPAEVGDKITVRAALFIRHIDIDEKKSRMSLYSWFNMRWTDYKLKWNADDYGGLTVLYLAIHELWLPDIYPYDSVPGDKTNHFGSTNVLVYNNGSVVWGPPTTFEVFCEMDLTYWPFDTQTCLIYLGSWSYSANFLDIDILDCTSKMCRAEQNTEWKIDKVDWKKHVVYYSGSDDPYLYVRYDITVRRQSPTYVVLIATPATAIIIMALAVFLIPPLSTDKITLGGTAIIITSLFLLYFTHKLPMQSENTPLIVMFYSKTLYLLSFSLIISVIVINLAKNPKCSPLPWSIKRLLTGCPGKYLLINNLSFKSNSKSVPNSSFKSDEGLDSFPVLSEQEKHNEECGNYEMIQRDWILFAVAIDRITFLIYCFIFIILAITYSI